MITLANASRILRKGVAGYLLGGLFAIPFFALMIFRIVWLLNKDFHWHLGFEPGLAIAAAIAVPLWLRVHLLPAKAGSGSGCGGSGCGGDGGHGCGSGCGGGGGCGGGCGGGGD